MMGAATGYRNLALIGLAALPGSVTLLALVCAFHAKAQAEERDWSKPRAEMVRVIEDYGSSIPDAVGQEGLSEAVLDVMRGLPRHHFVPDDLANRAYADSPLPIGHGQTISQPFIVALMTHLLDTGPEATVLEIGTGSGYQAAVVSKLVKTVCTIEIIPELGKIAARRFDGPGYGNVQTRIGDGYFGWPDCGPFDGILVTAAAGHVPPPLVEQLRPGGRMVIPVGHVFGPQFLTLVEKTETGQVRTRQVLPVRFVPLTRGSE